MGLEQPARIDHDINEYCANDDHRGGVINDFERSFFEFLRANYYRYVATYLVDEFTINLDVDDRAALNDLLDRYFIYDPDHHLFEWRSDNGRGVADTSGESDSGGGSEPPS